MKMCKRVTVYYRTVTLNNQISISLFLIPDAAQMLRDKPSKVFRVFLLATVRANVTTNTTCTNNEPNLESKFKIVFPDWVFDRTSF